MSEFVPENPDFENRIRAAFAAQGFMHLIGAVLGDVRPGFVEIRVPFRDDLCQHDGVYHGGLIGTLCDNSAAAAAGTLAATGFMVLTVEYKINFLNPGIGEALTARGRVLKSGRSLKVCRADAYCLADGAETHCASALVTVMTMARPAEG